MLQKTQKMYDQLRESISNVDRESENGLSKMERILHLTGETLAELKHNIKTYTFETSDQEIEFYKGALPNICSIYIVYAILYHIESSLPIGPLKARKKFLHKELSKMEDYKLENFDFYKYYKSGKTYLDQIYFRKNHTWNEVAIEPL